MALSTTDMYKKLRPQRSRKTLLIIGLVALLIVLFIVYRIYINAITPLYSWTTVNAFKGDVVSYVSATGKISATNEVLIGSQVSGKISAVFVEENDNVKKGDVLAIINPDTINQNITKNEALLASAKANLNSMQIAYENSLTNYKRLKEVYDATGGRSPSKTDLDNALMTMRKGSADVEIAKAKILEVETSLNSAKIDLKNSIITSPIDGVVLAKKIDAGQTVAASFNTPELFTIAENLEKMKLVVNVSEADVGKVFEGQTIQFTVDTFPNENFTSTVYRVNKGATISTDKIVSYETTIYVDNKDMLLRSGMSATADIRTESSSNVVLVPLTAIFFQMPDLNPKKKKSVMGPMMMRSKNEAQVVSVSKNTAIYVLDENGVPSKREVVTGVSDGKNIEIVSGIAEGEKVVIASIKNK